MNDKAIETVYRQLGQYIIDNVSNDWTTAWITAEVVSGNNLQLQGRYFRREGDTAVSFPVGFAAVQLFTELRQKLKRDDKEAWSRATFALQSDGEFEIDLQY